MNSACSFGRRPGRTRSGRLRSSCTPVRASSNVSLETPYFWASTQSSWSQRPKSASARAGAPNKDGCGDSEPQTGFPNGDPRLVLRTSHWQHCCKSLIVLAFILILESSALPSHFKLYPLGFPMSDMELQVAGDDRSRRAQFGEHRSLSTGYMTISRTQVCDARPILRRFGGA